MEPAQGSQRYRRVRDARRRLRARKTAAGGRWPRLFFLGFVPVRVFVRAPAGRSGEPGPGRRPGAPRNIRQDRLICIPPWGIIDVYGLILMEAALITDDIGKRAAVRLARIEGQVQGVRRMIEKERYCIDILTQLSAVTAAVRKVEALILENHLQTCVAEAMRSGDPELQQEKIAEIMLAVQRFRK